MMLQCRRLDLTLRFDQAGFSDPAISYIYFVMLMILMDFFLQVESFLQDAKSKVCLSTVLVILIYADLEQDHGINFWSNSVGLQNRVALPLPDPGAGGI